MLTQNWCEASGCNSKSKSLFELTGRALKERMAMWGGKNTGHLFKKSPENYRSSLKKHFKFPGNFKRILGDESVVSLWRKRHLKKKTFKTLARISPRRDVYLSWRFTLEHKVWGCSRKLQNTSIFGHLTSHPYTAWSWSFFPQRLCLRKEILRLFLQGCCFRLSVRELKSWAQDAKIV